MKDARPAPRLRPHAILMDVGLPVTNGIEATRQVVAFAPGANVIALSTYVRGMMADLMLQAGAMASVPKPEPSARRKDAIRAASPGG